MYRTLPILIILLCTFQATAQSPFRVMFYNVENFFDTDDDPLTADEEFLPSGNRRWTTGRYYNKLQQIAKVISAAGEWDTPALAGLCEVENDTVLTHLLRRTPLRNQHYHYCITKGSDVRGINTALLYQRDKFKYIEDRSIPVRHHSAAARPTRNILHVSGEIITGDTLDVFVCHFPSRYGGEKESEARRMDAVHTLRRQCDSLMLIRKNPLILLMGDFNDLPDSESMRAVAGKEMFNLFTDHTSQSVRGSHKYRSEWNQFDQILVHKNMLSDRSKIRLMSESAGTLCFPFLFTKDKIWRSERPFRTYHGYKYEGGFSDHLPVIADFSVLLPPEE
jgi:endonuclease/exonuclease/phosphatase family metal-dependent hydrolase